MYRISSNRRPGVYFSADPAGRRLNGAGVYLLHVSCPRPPTLRSARQGLNLLQFVRPYGKPRERQAHSIAFYWKDRSKHLFCAIGVAVYEVQLSPLSLPRGARGQRATPPSWYRADPASNRAPRPYYPRRLNGAGDVYSRKYGTQLLSTCPVHKFCRVHV